jgi:hypothetical protein
MKTSKLILYICFCLIFWNGLSAQSESEISPIKKVVYTCICGNYDSLITHTSIHADWDYICFTDNKKLLRYKHPQWIIRPLAYVERDNTRNNRWHKMFPDKILGEYDVSLYIDGNINITNSTLIDYINNELIDDKSKTLVINKHLVRNCIYQEANECKLRKLDSESVIDNQMQMLKQLNYPEACGLTENFMIYRRHHDEEVKELMTDWWWWVSNFSKRDQLSFNFVIWNRNFKIHIFEPQFSRSGTCLEFVNHKPK